MLVVESVVPQGPADRKLEPGDVLVSVAGKFVTHFLLLETLMDEAVGTSIQISLERGGMPFSLDIQVRDYEVECPKAQEDMHVDSTAGLGLINLSTSKSLTVSRPIMHLVYLMLSSTATESGHLASATGPQVQDLHAVTPACFLEVGGATLHALSYQQARSQKAPTGSVYVADAGYILSRAGREGALSPPLPAGSAFSSGQCCP